MNGLRPSFPVCLVAACCILLLGILRPSLGAAPPGWPQWLGPERSCVVPEGSLPDAWSQGGPKRLRQVPCEEGCSTPVVSDGRVVVMDRIENTERILCMSARDGKPLWKVDYAETHEPDRKWGRGARSTPATDGQRVYCLGIAGQLTCVEMATGKVTWQQRLLGPNPRLKGGYGVYSNILLEGDLMIVMRTRSPAVVALNKRSGQVVWRALSTGEYFGTPTSAVVAGRRQVVVAVRKHMAGLDPKTGKVLWQHPHPKAIDALMTPVVHRDIILFRGYGIPSYAFRLSADETGFHTKNLWTSREITPWFNAPAARAGRLYVANQGYRRPFLFCCEMETGNVLWKFRIKGLASKVSSWVLVAGDKLLVQVEDGRLILGRDAGKSFKELGRTTIFSKTAFAMPALVGGRLYARDFSHVVCLQLIP